MELKNRSDYEFAKSKFEQLWENSVDLSERFVQTINEKTWLNQNITPYELYLKFLYEYFKDELSRNDELFTKYLPQNFKKLEYQEQAVLNAKKILEEYGGVFISDVVGLGKTYIATMLAGQLDGRTIVIAPPSLLDKNNPGSWPNAFSDFHIPAEFVSVGKLDETKKRIMDREYKNVIIDEAHRFRTETTISYEDIAEICRGKRVILISATPYNNSPKDILAQIKLFQKAKKSTIPGVPDLESFLGKLEAKLKDIDREKNYNKYLEITRSNAKEIRDKVLKYLMVRRTRSEIEKYFAEDLKKNNVKFPDVEDPKAFYYQLSDDEDKIFMKTIELITQQFKYARYTPMKRDKVWQSMKIFRRFEIDDIVKTSGVSEGTIRKIIKCLLEHDYIKEIPNKTNKKAYIVLKDKGPFPVKCDKCGRKITRFCKHDIVLTQEQLRELETWMMHYTF